MYFGESQIHLDEKGRITLPSRFRDVMRVLGHDVWYMTRGFDGCIFMFHREGWNAIRAQVGRYPQMNAKAVDFRRFFFGSVAEIRADRQGRVPLPPHLREYAGLNNGSEAKDNEAVVIGVDDHLEVWSKKGWRAFTQSREAEFKEMAAQLFVGDGGSAGGAAVAD